jgi:hypothetical protein
VIYVPFCGENVFGFIPMRRAQRVASLGLIDSVPRCLRGYV